MSAIIRSIKKYNVLLIKTGNGFLNFYRLLYVTSSFNQLVQSRYLKLLKSYFVMLTHMLK